MKKSIVAVSLVALLMAACSSTKETKSGYKYNVVRAGDGKLPATGQILILNMSFKDSKDSVWSDSRKADYPNHGAKARHRASGRYRVGGFSNVDKR